jgi:lipoprotein-anchoring transpeptidase ErfK/SrfK
VRAVQRARADVRAVGPVAAALIGGPGEPLPYPHEPMPGSRRTIALLVLLACALAPSAAHAAKLPPATPPGTVKLSNETTTTRWAHTADVQPVFSRPSADARQITKLRLLTEDSFPEVYVVLSSWKNSQGNTWLKIRVPMRPNGRTGWVRESALSALHTIHTQLRVNRHTLRVTLYDHGRKRLSARIGVGKAGTPTPAGHFWIREKFRVRGGSIYGTRAIGTSAYAPTLSDWPGGGVVGLHGTNQPELIPGRPSHGCVRLRNRDIERLYRLAPTGTPVEIV